MFDSLINSLLVVAGLYVYLSLFRQVVVRQDGAAALGERQLGFPEAIAARSSSAGLCSMWWPRRKWSRPLFRRVIFS